MYFIAQFKHNINIFISIDIQLGAHGMANVTPIVLELYYSN